MAIMKIGEFCFPFFFRVSVCVCVCVCRAEQDRCRCTAACCLQKVTGPFSHLCFCLHCLTSYILYAAKAVQSAITCCNLDSLVLVDSSVSTLQFCLCSPVLPYLHVSHQSDPASTQEIVSGWRTERVWTEPNPIRDQSSNLGSFLP